MTTAELVVGSLCGIVLVSMFVWLAIALYLGYTKTDVLLNSFKNSSSVITISTRIHKGPWGKLQLVGSACSVVTFPRFFVKHGIAGAGDIESFPPFAQAQAHRANVERCSTIRRFSVTCHFVGIRSAQMIDSDILNWGDWTISGSEELRRP
jgi:hypothetical protein